MCYTVVNSPTDRKQHTMTVSFSTEAVSEAFEPLAKKSSPYFAMLTRMAGELADGLPDDERTAASFTVPNIVAGKKAANTIREVARVGCGVSARVRITELADGASYRVTFSVVPLKTKRKAA